VPPSPLPCLRVPMGVWRGWSYCRAVWYQRIKLTGLWRASLITWPLCHGHLMTGPILFLWWLSCSSEHSSADEHLTPGHFLLIPLVLSSVQSPASWLLSRLSLPCVWISLCGRPNRPQCGSCPFVCPSVRLVRATKSKTERRRNTKIGQNVPNWAPIFSLEGRD